MTNENLTSLSEDPIPSNGPVNDDKSNTWRSWRYLLSLISTIWRKLPLWRRLALFALPALVGCLVYANEDSMIVRVEGKFPITTLIEVEGPDGERLYTKWGQINRSLESSNLKMRIPEKSLVRGCINIVEFSIDDNSSEKESYFDTNLFKGKRVSGDEQEDLVLRYVSSSSLHSSFYLKNEPVSSPDCPPSNQSSEGFLDFLIPNAWADETTSTFEELINALTFDNALLRREARQLLVAKEIAAVKPVMAALRDDRWRKDRNKLYRLQIGAVMMLSEMLEGTVEADEIRTRLTEEDIRLLANLVINADDIMLQRLTETMTGLADPRAIDAFFQIINNHPKQPDDYCNRLINNSSKKPKKPDAYCNAKEVLKNMFKELLIQNQITNKLKEIANSQEKSIHDWIEQELQSVKEQKTEGWVYVGIFFGEDWDEKYFDWDGDSEGPPQKDDILTATGSVHLRVDHIRYEENKGWVNSRVIGIIQLGDTVKVLKTQTVAEGYHWVEVKKINGKRNP